MLGESNQIEETSSAREEERRKREEEETLRREEDAKAKAEALKKEAEREVERLVEEDRVQALRQTQERDRIAQEARIAERQIELSWMAAVGLGVPSLRLQIAALAISTDASSASASASASASSSPDEKKRFKLAINALHTIVQQIVKRPEEVNFRKIRVSNEQFQESVGRYKGGTEALVSLGFRVEEMVVNELGECGKVLFLKEPNLEREMDKWGDWFELLKSGLGLLAEEVEKVKRK